MDAEASRHDLSDANRDVKRRGEMLSQILCESLGLRADQIHIGGHPRRLAPSVDRLSE
jgi:hypothetical protein